MSQRLQPTRRAASALRNATPATPQPAPYVLRRSAIKPARVAVSNLDKSKVIIFNSIKVASEKVDRLGWMSPRHARGCRSWGL